MKKMLEKMSQSKTVDTNDTAYYLSTKEDFEKK